MISLNVLAQPAIDTAALLEHPFGFGYNTGYASDANRLHTPTSTVMRGLQWIPPILLH